MYKLLNAGFARIKKNKVFWGTIIVSLAVALITIFKYGLNDLEFNVDSLICGYTNIIGLVIAIFTSIFVGTEYDYGTIRNKIVIRT